MCCNVATVAFTALSIRRMRVQLSRPDAVLAETKIPDPRRLRIGQTKGIDGLSR
jgi:hypothetical protein